MKAIVVQEPGRAEVAEAPKPSMRPDYIRVKTVTFALNPTDPSHVDKIALKGNVIGCDFAGIVEEVDEKCAPGIQKGDKILGVCHGGNRNNLEDGAFGEYCMVKDGLYARIPSHMSLEDAVTFGVAITTIGQSYQVLGLPLPWKPTSEPFPLLVYGGSTAMGTFAIQYAKLSGLKVITTCSPHHFDLVKSRGADVALDYHSPSASAEIRSLTGNALCHALDCICIESSRQFCADALSSDGVTNHLKYEGLLLFDEFPREDVRTATWKLGYTAVGEAFSWPGVEGGFVASREDYEWASMWWQGSRGLLEEGGSGRIRLSIDDLRQKKVSGVKLVYRIGDTASLK